jgi:hypothetical protein
LYSIEVVSLAAAVGSAAAALSCAAKVVMGGSI